MNVPLLEHLIHRFLQVRFEIFHIWTYIIIQQGNHKMHLKVLNQNIMFNQNELQLFCASDLHYTELDPEHLIIFVNMSCYVLIVSCYVLIVVLYVPIGFRKTRE
jgi:hypothetical protein